MNSSRAKRFYFANKATLDTRLDLVASLLTLICDEMLPRSVSSSSIRQQFINDQTNYVEYDLLDEQIVASLQQITLDDDYSSAPIRYQSIVVVDQSRWYNVIIFTALLHVVADFDFQPILFIKINGGEKNLYFGGCLVGLKTTKK